MTTAHTTLHLLAPPCLELVPLDSATPVGVQLLHRSGHRNLISRLAKVGEEVCVKIEQNAEQNYIMYGRQFDHKHQLFSKVNRASIDALKKYFKDDMQDADWRLVIKLKKVFSVI